MTLINMQRPCNQQTANFGKFRLKSTLIRFSLPLPLSAGCPPLSCRCLVALHLVSKTFSFSQWRCRRLIQAGCRWWGGKAAASQDPSNCKDSVAFFYPPLLVKTQCLLIRFYWFIVIFYYIAGIITTQSKQIKASSPLTFRQTLLHFSIGMSRWNSSEHLPKISPWLLLSGSVLVPQCRVLNPINFTQHSGDCLKFLENDASSNIEYCSSGALGQNHNERGKD